jgi:hypothetical protein
MAPIIGYLDTRTFDSIPEITVPGILACLLWWAVMRVRLALRRKRERASKSPPGNL